MAMPPPVLASLLRIWLSEMVAEELLLWMPPPRPFASLPVRMLEVRVKGAEMLLCEMAPPLPPLTGPVELKVKTLRSTRVAPLLRMAPPWRLRCCCF